MSPTSYQAAPPRVIDTTRLAFLLQPRPRGVNKQLSCTSNASKHYEARFICSPLTGRSHGLVCIEDSDENDAPIPSASVG